MKVCEYRSKYVMLVYLNNLDKAKIDNFPSRLHYKFTSGFLFMSTAILGLNDMFGKVMMTVLKVMMMSVCRIFNATVTRRGRQTKQ